MRKEDLSTDTTFDPCRFSLDYTFKKKYLLGFFPCKAGLFRHFGHFLLVLYEYFPLSYLQNDL
jgi:hypothetical protein